MLMLMNLSCFDVSPTMDFLSQFGISIGAQGPSFSCAGSEARELDNTVVTTNIQTQQSKKEEFSFVGTKIYVSINGDDEDNDSAFCTVFQDTDGELAVHIGVDTERNEFSDTDCGRDHLGDHVCRPCTLSHLDDHECKVCDKLHAEDLELILHHPNPKNDKAYFSGKYMASDDSSLFRYQMSTNSWLPINLGLRTGLKANCYYTIV